MQTPEAGADSSSTVPLQTSVPVQPAVTAQQVPTQVPVQQQVSCSLVPTSPKDYLFVFFFFKHPHVYMRALRFSQAQTVQQVQHVYPSQVQYVEENSGVYTNGTM